MRGAANRAVNPIHQKVSMNTTTTLFIILKLTIGGEQISAHPYPDIKQCELAADKLRKTAPPMPLNGERNIYCKPS
jgi:hypothetical protein